MGFGWISLYLVRMGLAPLIGMIMEEFQISYATAGALFSAVFYAYGLMQLPAGYLGDRFGRRRILVIGTFLWFLLSLATVFAKTFTMLILARLLTGMAHGIYFGNDRPTITAYTPKEKMGQGQGISFMGLCLGLFFSVFLAGMIAEYFQRWRLVFVVFSFPSLITSFMIFKYIQEPPGLSSDGKPLQTRLAYREALIDRNLWLMYIVGFLMLFAYWVLVTWMPSIYKEMGIKGVTNQSLLSGIMGLIGVPGLIISGMLSDWIVQKGYRRKGFIATAMLIWALLMLGLGFAIENRTSSTLIAILSLSSALFVFGVWAPYFALLSEMAQKAIVGTTFGVANFIGSLSAWVAPSLTGWMKDNTGSFAAGLYLSGFLMVGGVILMMAVSPLKKGRFIE